MKKKCSKMLTSLNTVSLLVFTVVIGIKLNSSLKEFILQMYLSILCQLKYIQFQEEVINILVMEEF